MADNFPIFQSDLLGATREAREFKRVFIQRAALEAATRVVLKTPVATGRARGSWQTVEGGPGASEGIGEDPSGSAAISQAAAAVAAFSPNVSFATVYSNLEYMPALENGHSEQAPNGMVAVTVAELEGGGIPTSDLKFSVGRSDR